MNSKLKTGLILFVGIAAAAIGFALWQPDNTAPASKNELAAQSEGVQAEGERDPLTTAGTGRYVDYTPELIAATPGPKVLFFHAPWCSQCRSIESGINQKTLPDGLTIIKVDYDTNQALRQKYGVTLQTTFVKIDDSGKFISKYIAYDEPFFQTVKNKYLN